MRDIKAEPKDWEPPPPVLATPHTTQHPLDYIQEQLKQANLQVCYLKTVSVKLKQMLLFGAYNYKFDIQ